MPAGPGYGLPAQGQFSNTLSKVALMFGIFGGLLGVILGIVALRQIARTGEKGRGFAIGGIVMSCLWMVFIAAGLVLEGTSVLSSDNASGSNGMSRTEAEGVDVKKIKVGDCINDDKGVPNTAHGEQAMVKRVEIVPCDGPHDGEVMAAFQMSGSVKPDERQMFVLVSDGCKERMLSRLRRDPAAGSLDVLSYYPTADSWRQGDRNVVCLAVAADEGTKLTRPISP
ncbi:DUF4190 domain-containing protein [Actinomadura sp. 6K520]|uniref:DUF4190 domain-containing protein n=1 Tax=Actinomadura sp. 6K520 TaxID=2530364 RepID=UPI00140541F2|nr:DUF4190 domain-containing protein [Actinomadura sp. 6K520]